jgi:membrane protease YdiL (CAAX protease family)
MEEEDEGPRPFGVLPASLWCIASTIAMTVVVAIFEGLRPGASSDLVTLTLARVFAVGLVVLLVSRLHAPESSFRSLLGGASPRAWHVALALVLGLSLCLCLGFVDERISAAYPLQDEADRTLTEKLLATPSAGRHVFLVFSLMGILPVCHELLFRGVVFTGLARAGKPTDAAITTVLLEILTVGLTGDVRSLPSTVTFAIVATFVRFTTKSLFPAIALHVAYYASVLLVAFKPAWADHDVPRALAAGAAIAALVCIVVLRSASSGKLTDSVSAPVSE